MFARGQSLISEKVNGCCTVTGTRLPRLHASRYLLVWLAQAFRKRVTCKPINLFSATQAIYARGGSTPAGFVSQSWLGLEQGRIKYLLLLTRILVWATFTAEGGGLDTAPSLILLSYSHTLYILQRLEWVFRFVRSVPGVIAIYHGISFIHLPAWSPPG